MSNSGKIFIGILSFWPLAYMFIFFAFFFSAFFGSVFAAGTGGELGGPFAWGFGAVFVLHGLTILTSFGLVAFYVYRFFRDDTLDETKTLLWSLLVFVGNMFAFPFAWYVHVWRDDDVFADGEDEASTPL